jgi:hypothetical protein
LLLGWNDCGFVDGVEQEAVGSEVAFLGHEDYAWEHFRCAADCKTYPLTKPPPEAPSLRTQNKAANIWTNGNKSIYHLAS